MGSNPTLSAKPCRETSQTGVVTFGAAGTLIGLVLVAQPCESLSVLVPLPSGACGAAGGYRSAIRDRSTRKSRKWVAQEMHGS